MRTLRLLLICGVAIILAACGEPDLRSKAEGGDSMAQCSLGMMYRKGEGVPKDAAEAAKWFRKAADQGDADAQYDLALMYRSGEGVPKDAAEAVKWYRKAADQGDAKAQFYLGGMYEKGEGVAKDDAEAYSWYNLASVSYDDARKWRDELEKSLTPEQRARAQQRSTELHKEIEAGKNSIWKEIEAAKKAARK